MKKIFLIAIFGLQVFASDIVVTIKPLYSLVQSVLGDTQKATLLLNKKESIHAFSIKPSHMRAINGAKVIFYIDEHLETFMENAIEDKSIRAKKVSATEAKGVKLLAIRNNDNWEKHMHDEDGHEEDEHHDDDDDEEHHDEDEKHHDDDEEHHDEDEHHDEHNNEHDLHVWLDTKNAKAIVEQAVQVLSEYSSKDKKTYRANGDKIIAQIEKLEKELKTRSKAIANKPYIVFHDAYQYMENEWKLNAVGSIHIDPSLQISAKKIRNIRTKLDKFKVKCVLKEPQFLSQFDKTIATIIQKRKINIGILDPMGEHLGDVDFSYTQMLRDNFSNLEKCL